jgi:hypothetical protein
VHLSQFETNKENRGRGFRAEERWEDRSAYEPPKLAPRRDDPLTPCNAQYHSQEDLEPGMVAAATTGVSSHLPERSAIRCVAGYSASERAMSRSFKPLSSHSILNTGILFGILVVVQPLNTTESSHF